MKTNLEANSNEDFVNDIKHLKYMLHNVDMYSDDYDILCPQFENLIDSVTVTSVNKLLGIKEMIMHIDREDDDNTELYIYPFIDLMIEKYK